VEFIRPALPPQQEQALDATKQSGCLSQFSGMAACFLLNAGTSSFWKKKGNIRHA
jgi:hypothetical protein